MKVIAFIFARGGSKGLPGKNIRPLGGKPLIAWSIEHALAVKRISVFIAVILGGVMFKEHSLKRRIIATAMLVIGTLLIV